MNWIFQWCSELRILRQSARGKALPGLHRSSPLFPCEKKKNKTGRPWKYNAIHIRIKNYTYEVTSCAGALSPRSSTACSRCTGPKPCALHRAPCYRPRTAYKKGRLPHGSGIFPVARDTGDEWPFWYSIVLTCLVALEASSLHSHFLTAHHTCTVFLNLIFLLILFFSSFSPWNFSRANFPSCKKTVNAKV